MYCQLCAYSFMPLQFLPEEIKLSPRNCNSQAKYFSKLNESFKYIELLYVSTASHDMTFL